MLGRGFVFLFAWQGYPALDLLCLHYKVTLLWAVPLSQLRKREQRRLAWKKDMCRTLSNTQYEPCSYDDQLNARDDERHVEPGLGRDFDC